MKIALVCNKYSADENNPWLTNDLAKAYVDLGHEVTVYCLDWSGAEQGYQMIDSNGIDINYLQHPTVFRRLGRKINILLKWILNSWLAAKAIRAPKKQFDLLVYFSPALTTIGMVNYLKQYTKKTVMILWDFFPKYHQELEVFPNVLAITKLAKSIEQKAVNHADLVGLMSPENITFINNYFINTSNQKRVVVPLWGPAPLALVSTNEKPYLKTNWHNLPRQKVWAVMGGQMIPGRGLELLLNVASKLLNNSDLVFVVAGDGVHKKWFLDQMQDRGLTNIIYIGSLKRREYLDLLQAADIGLVFNSGHVSVPTFPSKSVDYLRTALPMIVSIEKASDAGHIIEHEMQAGFNVEISEIDQIAEKIELLVKDDVLRENLGKNGYQYFIKNMTAKSVANQILRNVDLGRDI